MKKRLLLPLTVSLLGIMLLGAPAANSNEESVGRDDRDKEYFFYGRDGHIHDFAIEYPIKTIPSNYGRIVAILESPFNPKERELWFEANDGTVRRLVLIPVKKKKPPYLIYQEVLKLERD